MAELSGQSVVVTRPRVQAGTLVRLLAKRGAHVIERATIEVALRRDAETIARLASIGPDHCDALLVTSGNAAWALAEHCPRSGRSLPVYAVGAATAEALWRHGFSDVHVAKLATSEGLLEHLRTTLGQRLAGMRFLTPQSSRASDVLVEGLTAAKASVDIVVAYDTMPVLDGPPLPAGRIDWVTFTSPSAIDGFIRALALPKGARVACLGPTTAAAARNAGLIVHVTPSEPSLPALVDAIAAAG